jgi:hypothetical protein
MDVPRTFWTKPWLKIAANGFLFTGGCLGSKWPIVPWVTLHFASFLIPAGKSSIVNFDLVIAVEEVEVGSQALPHPTVGRARIKFATAYDTNSTSLLGYIQFN